MIMHSVWNTIHEFETHIATFAGGALIAFFMPTRGFVTALVVMFCFNLWCGMRADGISIRHCRRFSFGKLWKAFVELILYMVVIQVVYSVIRLMGDEQEGIFAVKTLTYILLYFGYFQNSFKNLILAYPKNRTLRIVYHVVRFEFKKILPSTLSESIDAIEKEVEGEMMKKRRKR